MTTISRRELFVAGGVITAAAALDACAIGTMSLTQLAEDVNTIAGGVNTVLPGITGISGLSSTVLTTIENAITDIGKISTDVKNGTTSTLTGLTTDITSIVNNLSSFKLPTWVTMVLDAAEVLAPYVLSLAGIALAPSPTSQKMTPEAARVVLRAAVVEHPTAR